MELLVEHLENWTLMDKHKRGVQQRLSYIKQNVKIMSKLILNYIVLSASGSELQSKDKKHLQGLFSNVVHASFQARPDYPKDSDRRPSIRRPFVFEDLSDSLAELTPDEQQDFDMRVRFFAGEASQVLASKEMDDHLKLWGAVGDVALLLSDLPYNQKKRTIGAVTELEPSDRMDKAGFAAILNAAQRHLKSTSRVVVRCHPSEVEEKKVTLNESRFKTAPHPMIVTKSPKVKTKGQCLNTHKFNSVRGFYAMYATATKSLRGQYAARAPYDWTGQAGTVSYDFCNAGYVPTSLRLKDADGVPYRDEVTWQEFAVFMEWFTEHMQIILDICAGTGPSVLAGLRLNRRVIAIEREAELVVKAHRRARMFYKYLKRTDQLPEFGSTVVEPPTREETDPNSNWVTALAHMEGLYKLTRTATRKRNATDKLRNKMVADLPRGVSWNAKVEDGLPKDVASVNHTLEKDYESMEAYHAYMKKEKGLLTMDLEAGVGLDLFTQQSIKKGDIITYYHGSLMTETMCKAVDPVEENETSKRDIVIAEAEVEVGKKLFLRAHPWDLASTVNDGTKGAIGATGVGTNCRLVFDSTYPVDHHKRVGLQATEDIVVDDIQNPTRLLTEYGRHAHWFDVKNDDMFSCWVPGCGKSNDDDMIPCHTCHRLSHSTCVGLDPTAFEMDSEMQCFSCVPYETAVEGRPGSPQNNDDDDDDDDGNMSVQVTLPKAKRRSSKTGKRSSDGSKEAPLTGRVCARVTVCEDDRVGLYPHVISLSRSKALLQSAKSVGYANILNPGGRRKQSAIARSLRVPGATTTDKQLHDVMHEVTKKIDQLTLSNAGPDPTPVAPRFLLAMKNCKAQLHHPDRERGPSQGKALSVILAIQEGTALEICHGPNGPVTRVLIPICGVLVFWTDVIHGGAAYEEANYRAFWKIVPGHMAARERAASTEAREYLETAQYCRHNLTICNILSCF